MSEINKQKINYKRAIDIAILLSIGIFSFCYSKWGSTFAEVHFRTTYLSFPIFLGEMLLGFCLFFWILKRCIAKESITIYERWWCVYLVLVCVVALIGFKQWGPLALRNSALFYYPLFALISFSCFRKDFFNRFSIILLAALTFFLVASRFITGYFWLTYVLLSLGLILKIKDKHIKIFSLISLFLLAHLGDLFVENRTHLISSMFAMFFVVYIILRHNFYTTISRLKIPLVLLLIGIVILGVRKYSDHNGVKTILKPLRVIEEFRYEKEIINDAKVHWRKEPNPIAFYADNVDIQVKDVLSDQEMLLSQNYPTKRVSIEKGKKETVETVKNNKEVKVTHVPNKTVSIKVSESAVPEKQTAILVNEKQEVAVVDVPQKKQYRSIEVANNNILFRMFIWEDMVKEMWSHKAIFGMGFGWPQRSPNLEILGWGASEWMRDGWVAMHNSFLHIIYRAGLLGIGLIVLLFYFLNRDIRVFIKRRDTSGVVLTAALIYWIVGSNFGVVLELPYYAIPFWTLFGMTHAYANKT